MIRWVAPTRSDLSEVWIRIAPCQAKVFKFILSVANVGTYCSRLRNGFRIALVAASDCWYNFPVSKVFTASAVAVLLDRGIVNLFDDICDVLPLSWSKSACRNPKYPAKLVTRRMMVTHRSSLRDYIPAVRNAERKTCSAQLRPKRWIFPWFSSWRQPYVSANRCGRIFRDFLSD